MKIAIASGKGGTGKTTVAVHLFHFLSKNTDQQVQLIDCDVEEPNDLLFFNNLTQISVKKMVTMVPTIDLNKCIFCKKCSEWCEFNAITIVKNLKFAEVNKDLCHSCGACTVACDYGAITEFSQALGEISDYSYKQNNRIIEGRLEIGSAMQTALIKKLKKHADIQTGISIFDAPPGTSCPVVETVFDADYIILVTEPTPFGLYDLQLTVELIEELKIPFGVIVNKAGLGNDEVYTYLTEKHIELIGEIPFSKTYASHYSSGNLIQNISEELVLNYQRIIEKIMALNYSE